MRSPTEPKNGCELLLSGTDVQRANPVVQSATTDLIADLIWNHKRYFHDSYITHFYMLGHVMVLFIYSYITKNAKRACGTYSKLATWQFPVQHQLCKLRSSKSSVSVSKNGSQWLKYMYSDDLSVIGFLVFRWSRGRKILHFITDVWVTSPAIHANVTLANDVDLDTYTRAAVWLQW